ncbi:MAG TPA: DUF1800 domain-containing protein [Terriglobales bacterium]|nr:DUF1800 domain-containing protein [Terriglobales bacterium]
MPQSRTKHLLLTPCLATALVILPASYLPAKDKKKPGPKSPAVAQMDESKKGAHVLNRLAFGPRPGEVDRVAAIGVEKWIEQQLNPEKIDDSVLQARLSPFRTLQMDNKEIVANFPPPAVLQAIAAGRVPMPSDPKTRAIYESQLAIYKARVENRKQNGDADVDMRPPEMNDEAAQNNRRAERRKLMPSIMALMQKSASERTQAVLKMDPAERRAMIQALTPQEREKLVADMSYEQRETLLAMANPQGVVTNELMQAKLLRAIYSERQLEEVMTDFWFNHFNVFLGKGADRYLTTAYEREAIRKHALGKFEDMLVATAKDPAMLFYLDNFQSVGPNSLAGKRSGQARFQGARRNRAPNQEQPMMVEQPAPPVQRGLNENYARELMELHTLGVDGGYTQKDIVEVAKVFTGWTARQPRLGGDFEFIDRIHEPGTKIVLGQKIEEGGEGEGRKVLHLLATHPATAKFISRKLAMRFVSDNPPPALLDKMSATFLKTNGDIKQVLRTLFHSPEFWAPEAYRAKVKTPLEFVVSAVRVTGTDVRNPQGLVQTLNKLGMPLYGAQPPTGYSMKAEAWVNSAALLNRMNFALSLANGQVRGVDVSSQRALEGEVGIDNEKSLEMMARTLLAGDVSKETLATIRKQMSQPQYQQVNNPEMASPAPRGPNDGPGAVAGLILGSPEFQRR